MVTNWTHFCVFRRLFQERSIRQIRNSTKLHFVIYHEKLVVQNFEVIFFFTVFSFWHSINSNAWFQHTQLPLNVIDYRFHFFLCNFVTKRSGVKFFLVCFGMLSVCTDRGELDLRRIW